MAPVALAFAVLDLGGSPTDLGLVLALAILPQVFFLLVGGVIADRLPRHLVMVASNLVAGLAQAVAAYLLISGNAEIWQLAVIALVRAVAASFFYPASAGDRAADRADRRSAVRQRAPPAGAERDQHRRRRARRPARRRSQAQAGRSRFDALTLPRRGCDPAADEGAGARAHRRRASSTSSARAGASSAPAPGSGSSCSASRSRTRRRRAPSTSSAR